MNRRQFMATAILPLLAGCTGGGGSGGGGATATPSPTKTEAGMGTPTETTATQSQADKTVLMKNTTFQPLKAEVQPGATVKWVNKDGFSHDVTAARFHDSAADWNFSKTLSSGQSTTYTFENEGIYEYYCTIHGKGTMCGAVLVGSTTLDKSLPCSNGGGGGGYGGGGYG